MSVISLVREESRQYTPHDQLFKELIHNFFEEFLVVFFPEVHEYVDFHSVKPLSEEVFTDLHDGDARRLDIVIETTIKNQETFVIIHIEPQSSNFTQYYLALNRGEVFDKKKLVTSSHLLQAFILLLLG